MMGDEQERTRIDVEPKIAWDDVEVTARDVVPRAPLLADTVIRVEAEVGAAIKPRLGEALALAEETTADIPRRLIEQPLPKVEIILATPSIEEPAPPPKSPRKIALPAIAFVISAVVLAWAFWPPSEPEEVAVRASASVALSSTAPIERSREPALARAPSLRQAANLVATGSYDDAARAYEALARDHRDRPELATMARVLREKARR